MNKRDFGKLLEQLHTELAQDILDLKKDLTSAKRLKTNLESYFEECQNLIDEMTRRDGLADDQLASINEVKEQVDAIKLSAANSLEEIQSSIGSIEQKSTEMEDAYESFTEINEKITDEETGLEAVYVNIQSIETDIAQLNAQAENHLETIQASLVAIQKNVTEMEDAYESFTEINEKITDEETGLEAILESSTASKNDITAIKTGADTIYKEIRKFRDEAAGYVKEIGGLKSTATSAVEIIQSNHDTSNDLKSKIEEIFNISSKKAHSNYFVQRRNQLFWISFLWLILFLGFLITAGVLAINLVLPLLKELSDPSMTISLEVLIIRAIIISPFIFGAVYALLQYSSERRLYEKYAFKAVTSFSAETSVATLTRSLASHVTADKDAKIVDFAVNVFASLYQEPVEPVKEKWTLKGGNKLLDLTTEVSKSVGKIEDEVDKISDKISS